MDINNAANYTGGKPPKTMPGLYCYRSKILLRTQNNKLIK